MGLTTVLRKRSANSFANAADIAISLKLLANRTILVEHWLLLALHLLSGRLCISSYCAACRELLSNSCPTCQLPLHEKDPSLLTALLVERTADLLGLFSYFAIGMEGTSYGTLVGIETRLVGHFGGLNGEWSGGCSSGE